MSSSKYPKAQDRLFNQVTEKITQTDGQDQGEVVHRTKLSQSQRALLDRYCVYCQTTPCTCTPVQRAKRSWHY